jgi:hypothetical protein
MYAGAAPHSTQRTGTRETTVKATRERASQRS